jgi:hypothetical protein
MPKKQAGDCHCRGTSVVAEPAEAALFTLKKSFAQFPQTSGSKPFHFICLVNNGFWRKMLSFFHGIPGFFVK